MISMESRNAASPQAGDPGSPAPETDRPDSTELAEERTDFAEDRTLLANERTFAGWMRTGLACVAVGLGLRALMRQFEPDWLPKLIGTAFIAAGIVVIWLAYRRARRVLLRLSSHRIEPLRASHLRPMALATTTASAALAVLLWLL